MPLAINSRISALNTNDGAVLPGAVSRLFAAVEREPLISLALAGCDWAFIEPTREWRELRGALPRFRFICGAAAAACERPIGACADKDVQSIRSALGGTVNLAREDAQQIEVDVDAPDAGMFVLADTYYPGWYATVDGRAAEIIAAHGVFRGVRLTAGKHRVALVYDPWSFKIGCALSACGLLGLAWMVWMGRRQNAKLRIRHRNSKF